MALFPNPGAHMYDERDTRIRQRMETFYQQSITMNQAFWAEADLDARFEAGEQSVWSEVYGHDPVHHRRQFSFNRIRRIINMITGYQRRNRKSTVVMPVENGAQETADQFSKIMMWADRNDQILETISEAFHGAVVSGMNLLHVWLDYREDPISGNIRVDNCSYNSFLIDPYFRKSDLSDCNGIWKRSFVTKREAISLLPDKEDDIMNLNANDKGHDEKFAFMPENFNRGGANLLVYDEYYYRDFRTQILLVDTKTGETQEWTGDDDKLQEFLDVYPEITTIKQEKPTVRLAIVVQGKVMYDGPNPIGIDEYPFVPVFAFYRPELPYYQYRIQGITRDLRDAQYLYNRRKVIELDILESQVNSGWKLKENTLVDSQNDPFMTGQGRALFLKQEANMDDAQQIQPPQVPPSMMQLSQTLAQEIQEISGVNEELLGAAQDDKAGVLSALRQGAGLTTLQSLFDQLDTAQKILGKRILSIIQTNFAPGKVKKIIEDEPQPEFYNKNFGRYDAVVEQGVNTVSQQQMEFMQLLQLKEYGLPIPDETIINAATLQNKNELIKTMQQQQEQQQQQQQMQQQMQMEQQRANIEATEAQAKSDTGRGLERLSRVKENEALADERYARTQAERMQAQENVAQANENRMQAQENRYDSYLNMARALKEMQGTDLENIQKLIQVAQQLKSYEESQEGREQASQRRDMAGLSSLSHLRRTGPGREENDT